MEAAGAKTFTFYPVGPIGDEISLKPFGLRSAGGTLEAAQVATVSTAGGYAKKSYYMMVPGPWDEKGFYLGAIDPNGFWTVRFRTQDLRYAATGALGVGSDPGIDLVGFYDHIPDSDVQDYKNYWANRAWRSSEWILHEPNTGTTLSTSGDTPAIRIDTFAHKIILEMFGLLHISRAYASAAYWNLIKLPDKAQVRIETLQGAEVFTSDATYLDSMKYHRIRAEIFDTKALSYNTLPVLYFPFGDHKVFTLAGVITGAVMPNDYLNVIITDAVSISTTPFLDLVARCAQWYCIDNMMLAKIEVP